MSHCPKYQCKLCGHGEHYPSVCPNIGTSSNSEIYFTTNDTYDDFDNTAWANLTGELVGTY
jgi:hypothetical protein